MKCEMTDCTKKAKLKVSFSYGGIFHYCFKHSWRFIKSQLPRVASTEAAIFIQRPPVVPLRREIAPEAREHVTTPADRAAGAPPASDAWKWD